MNQLYNLRDGLCAITCSSGMCHLTAQRQAGPLTCLAVIIAVALFTFGGHYSRMACYSLSAGETVVALRTAQIYIVPATFSSFEDIALMGHRDDDIAVLLQCVLGSLCFCFASLSPGIHAREATVPFAVSLLPCAFLDVTQEPGQSSAPEAERAPR